MNIDLFVFTNFHTMHLLFDSFRKKEAKYGDDIDSYFDDAVISLVSHNFLLY